MKNIKLYLAIILSFMSGTLVSQFPIFVDAVNCNNIPTFHIIYLRQIKECLELSDKQLSDRQDATNMLIYNEITRLENEINQTRSLK